jgi:hypothetical protein
MGTSSDAVEQPQPSDFTQQVHRDIKADNVLLVEQPQPSDFTQQAEMSRPGLFKEFLLFMRDTKKWWLAPIILVLLLIGLLAVLSSTAAAPLIYTLF